MNMITANQDLLDRDNTVLVVVDMQEPFLRHISNRDGLLNGVTKLVSFAKALQIPVITTLQYREKMGDIIPELDELIPDAPKIDKTTFSCCRTAPFLDAMEQIGRKKVLLCGVETHICVNQTAHDLLSLGYRVHLAEDAVSSRHDSDRTVGINKMRQSGVIISSVEMAMFEMLGDAATPEFKIILQLVK